MSKKSKNMPQLRFPGYKGDWHYTSLGRITQYTKGFAFKSENYLESGVRIIRASDLESQAIRQEGQKIYVSKQLTEDQKIKKYKVHKGNIIITTVGSRAELRTSAVGRGIYVSNDNEGFLNQNLLKFENIDGINNRFLFGQINTDRYVAYIASIQRGNANQSNITVEDLLNYQISITGLSEQEKIASFLGAIDTRLTQLRRKHELLQTYKQGVMQQLFSQQIRFKRDDGKPFPDWENKLAKHIFKSHSNKSHDGDLPILAATQDQGMVFRHDLDLKISSSESSIKSYKIVEKGDFVISLRSFQGGIEYSEYYGICSPAYTILKPKIEIINYFYKQYFKKKDFIMKLSNIVVGIRDGKQISYDAFSELKLPLPCKEEQEKIVDCLIAFDKKIEVISQKINLTEQFKKGLLQKMFV